MDTSKSNDRDLQINSERLFALVREMTGRDGGRPRDDQPLPPGPGDPVIRAAVRHMDAFGPRPEPWRGLAFQALAARYPGIFDGPWGGGDPLEIAGLNPQPLPPRESFLESLVQTLVERMELLQEMASALTDEGEQRGIIIVSGYISRLLDEFCGTGFRPRFPFPGPRPRWFPEELDTLDLVVMAAHFDRAARETYSPALRESLAGASGKLLEAALSRQQ
jgi:hypothetical protein